MMNQDQYHASLLNSGQPVGLGWDGVTKASQPKVYPMEPPNDTDVDATIKQVRDDESSLTDLNWNNIKVSISSIILSCEENDAFHTQLTPTVVLLQNISDEKFIQLFEGLEMNTHLESLSLTNVGLNDKTGQRLADAVEKNSTLRVLKYAQNDVYFYI